MIGIGHFDSMAENYSATLCTRMFYLFQKVVIGALHVISSSQSSSMSGGPIANRIAEPNLALRSFQSINFGKDAGAFEKIKTLFLDCFYSFLDGLEYIASNTDTKDGNSLEDIDITEENGLPFKLSCSKIGSIVLEDASSGAKLKSKAESNRDTVR